MKSDRQGENPVTTYYTSIVLYSIIIRNSTSEYFTITECPYILKLCHKVSQYMV